MKPKLAKNFDDQCDQHWRGVNKLVSWACQLREGHEGAHVTFRGKRWLTKKTKKNTKRR